MRKINRVGGGRKSISVDKAVIYLTNLSLLSFSPEILQ
jgi:hypothetical protein